MALDNFRRIDMQINKANYYIDTQMAKEGDYNGRELVVQITDAGEIKNQSGVSLNLGWRHDSVGNTGLDPFTVVDITKGIFKIAYPKEMLNAGIVTAVIQVVESGKITLTRNFKITVEKNPIDEDAIVSENSFTILQEALLTIDKYDGKIASLEANKVSQSEFDSWVATLLDGGPSIFMNTLNELQTTYPNGSAGVALVRETDPAKIYVWNGTAWEDFGDYQGIEIKDGSVTGNKIANRSIKAEHHDNVLISSNLFDPSTVVEGYGINISTGERVANVERAYSEQYIEVAYPETISLSRVFGILIYDKDKNFITGNTYSNEDYYDIKFKPWNDAKFIRLMFSMNTPEGAQKFRYDSAQVNRGSELLSYEPYFIPKVKGLTTDIDEHILDDIDVSKRGEISMNFPNEIKDNFNSTITIDGRNWVSYGTSSIGSVRSIGNGLLSIDRKEGESGGFGYSYRHPYLKLGHTYYIYVEYKMDRVGDSALGRRHAIASTSRTTPATQKFVDISYEWAKASFSFKVTNLNASGVVNFSTFLDSKVQYRRPTIIDLTEIFGEKREPFVIQMDNIVEGKDWSLDYEISGKENLEWSLNKNITDTVKTMTKKLRPMVTFCLDDGILSDYEKAFPYFKEKGIRGTFFVNTKPGAINESNLREMSDYGQEIGSHTVNHYMLDELTTEELVYELGESKKRIEEVTGKPCLTLGIPSGRYSDKVHRLIGGFYEASRNSDVGNIPYGHRNPHSYSGHFLDWGGDAAVGRVKGFIDEAVEKRQWCIISMHRIINDGEVREPYQVYESDFKEIVDYVDSLRPDVEVVPFYEGARRIKNFVSLDYLMEE